MRRRPSFHERGIMKLRNKVSILVVFALLVLSCGSKDAVDDEGDNNETVSSTSWADTWALVSVDGKRIQSLQGGVVVDGVFAGDSGTIDILDILIDGTEARYIIDRGNFPKDILVDRKTAERIRKHQFPEFDSVHYFYLTSHVHLRNYPTGKMDVKLLRFTASEIPARFVQSSFNYVGGTYSADTFPSAGSTAPYALTFRISGYRDSSGKLIELTTNGTWTRKRDTLTMIRDDGLTAVFKQIEKD